MLQHRKDRKGRLNDHQKWCIAQHESHNRNHNNLEQYYYGRMV